MSHTKKFVKGPLDYHCENMYDYCFWINKGNPETGYKQSTKCPTFLLVKELFNFAVQLLLLRYASEVKKRERQAIDETLMQLEEGRTVWSAFTIERLNRSETLEKQGSKTNLCD